MAKAACWLEDVAGIMVEFIGRNAARSLLNAHAANQGPSAERYLDHPLSGKWKGYRDCHIRPDLLLIYQKSSSVLLLVRLGSHSELF